MPNNNCRKRYWPIVPSVIAGGLGGSVANTLMEITSKNPRCRAMIMIPTAAIAGGFWSKNKIDENFEQCKNELKQQIPTVSPVENSPKPKRG